jgi:signal transduction histidine kinase/HD-GYP domain-containing protein (c-di-GMP phosphodiesterase class II)
MLAGQFDGILGSLPHLVALAALVHALLGRLHENWLESGEWRHPSLMVASLAYLVAQVLAAGARSGTTGSAALAVAAALLSLAFATAAAASQTPRRITRRPVTGALAVFAIVAVALAGAGRLASLGIPTGPAAGPWPAAGLLAGGACLLWLGAVLSFFGGTRRQAAAALALLGVGLALRAFQGSDWLGGIPAVQLSAAGDLVAFYLLFRSAAFGGGFEVEIISADGSKNTHRMPSGVEGEVLQGAAWEGSDPSRQLARITQVGDPEEILTRYRETAALLRNRAQNLERILEIAVTINSKRNLNELLDKVVDSARESLGFKIVLLRVLNTKTQVFEARAFAGLNNDAISTLSEYRLPMSEYRMMTDERFRISRSYFISHEMNMWQEDEFSVIPDLGERKAGEWHEMDMLIVPLETQEGEVVGYLSVDDPVDRRIPTTETIEILEIFASQAVTAIANAELINELERKNRKLAEAAEKLSSLSRLKSDFVSTISHELRTPLTSIRAYTETLMSSAADLKQEQLGEFLQVINKESERLAKMIDDVLNLSRLEADDMPVEKVFCDVAEVIRDMHPMLERDASARNVRVRVNLPEHCPPLKADRELIRQVLANLANNAIKFTPQGGEVVLSVEDQSSHLRLTVEDTGIGIPEGQLEAIFDRFHQADTSSTREYGGSGLGLAICKNIVDWHDGKIWVENRPDQGARFVVLLPKKDALVSPQLKAGASLERRYHRSRFLELLVELVAETLQSKVVSLMTLDPRSKVLRVEAAIGLDEDIVEHTRVRVGSGVAGMVAETGETVLVENIETDDRIRRKASLPLYNTPSFVSVPIMRGNDVLGLFNVTDKVDGAPYGPEDARLLEAMCMRVSYVWDKMFGFEQALTEFDRVQFALRGILDATRFWGDRRTQFFAGLAVRSADLMGLGRDSQDCILYGMTVYDLGMTQISRQILHKPDSLSTDELGHIRQHVFSGSEMIDAVEFAPKIKEIILYHHERHDGSGYPEGLKGEAIPPEARVVGIVDTFRSLLSDRPYRPALGYLEALAEVRRKSGSLFDPALVGKFIQACQEMEETWSRLSSSAAKGPVEDVPVVPAH